MTGRWGDRGTGRPDKEAGSDRPIPPSPAPPIVVFCDFDGTITERDMVVSVAEKFCPPVWRQVVDDIVSRRKSVKDGVAELFAMIPSSKKQEILDYARQVMRLRSGFEEFLKFCKSNGIRFIVCSGGVDFFIEPLMAPFTEWIDRVVSIPADFSGPSITLKHIYACETEGTCKVKVMDEYPKTIRILIGDSITDLHGSRHANVVFARAALRGYLDEERIEYYPFETFHDILHRLSQFRGPH